ncbi:DNA polymerase III subunit alpha, partial [bacterium]|nr:DNA polymerase III subunit alpha [bacterium]
DDYALAKERLTFLKRVFHDGVCVELMNHGLPEQQKVNRLLLQLARELDLLPVATNDVHYLYKEDAELRDVVNCMASGETLDDYKRLKKPTAEYYVKSEEEMLAAFDFCPEAVANTQIVADLVEDDIINYKSVDLPKFQTADGISSEEFLRELCRKGIKERFGERWNDAYQKRLEDELGLIAYKGVSDFFLLMWDLVIWAQGQDIPVAGIGTVAGSLVAYLIGITQLDPLPYDLLFERFTNLSRSGLLNICPYFSDEGLPAAIEYCRGKYGEECVARIATYERMTAEDAIKNVARVMGISAAEADSIAQAIPFIPVFRDITLKDVLNNPYYKAIYDSKDVYKKLFDVAMRCNGMLCGTGIHRCGIIVSGEDLKSLAPLRRGPKGEAIVEYDWVNSNYAGLNVIHFNTLHHLNIINECLKAIGRNYGARLDMEKLTAGYNDPQVFRLLGDADTNGVFQLESAGMKRYLRQLQPDRFSDIVTFLALYRPGPIKAGVVDKFIDARHGRGGGVKYPHPNLEPILQDTYGFFIYQEQIMLTACTLAGYNLFKAYKLFRAMEKKKVDEMAKHRATFIEGAVDNGVDRDVAADVFSTMEKSAEYAFCKAHVAACAVVTYYTAYLKCYYRAEYMAAVQQLGEAEQCYL